MDERVAAVGNPQPDRSGRLGLAPEAAVGAVALLVGADVVGGGGGVVRVSAGEKLVECLGVPLGPLGLEDRPLVEIEVQPPQGVEDLVDVLRRGPRPVGIFDPQHEGAAVAPRQQPVVQRRSRAADVQCPGRGWSKSDSQGHEPSMLIGAHVSPAGGLPHAVGGV